jgi:hypothetical protein
LWTGWIRVAQQSQPWTKTTVFSHCFLPESSGLQI